MIWSDEAQFSCDGVVNAHNMHYWAAVNPHWVRETQQQTYWHVNIWCGILGDHIIGPVVCNGYLTGQCYLQLIIHNTVLPYVYVYPLQTDVDCGSSMMVHLLTMQGWSGMNLTFQMGSEDDRESILGMYLPIPMSIISLNRSQLA